MLIGNGGSDLLAANHADDAVFLLQAEADHGHIVVHSQRHSGNIGDIKYTLRNSAPHGAVFCNGQILTEEQYPDLYQMLIDNRLDISE